jgi:hypothetical protein
MTELYSHEPSGPSAELKELRAAMGNSRLVAGVYLVGRADPAHPDPC